MINPQSGYITKIEKETLNCEETAIPSSMVTLKQNSKHHDKKKTCSLGKDTLKKHTANWIL
jgi:hypothetical protein